MKKQNSQQLDLFDDYASDMQKTQADRLAVFYQALGLRRQSTIVFGDKNPLCEKEMFVPDIPGKDTGIFYQIIGNYGAYANKEFLNDTNIILLPDESLRKLEQGIKDDVILHLEELSKKRSAKFLNLKFTCESDFLDWVKRRLRTSPDEGTIRLLQIYEQS